MIYKNIAKNPNVLKSKPRVKNYLNYLKPGFVLTKPIIGQMKISYLPNIKINTYFNIKILYIEYTRTI